jgi:hypothetical protein
MPHRIGTLSTIVTPQSNTPASLRGGVLRLPRPHLAGKITTEPMRFRSVTRPTSTADAARRRHDLPPGTRREGCPQPGLLVVEVDADGDQHHQDGRGDHHKGCGDPRLDGDDPRPSVSHRQADVDRRDHSQRERIDGRRIKPPEAERCRGLDAEGVRVSSKARPTRRAAHRGSKAVRSRPSREKAFALRATFAAPRTSTMVPLPAADDRPTQVRPGRPVTRPRGRPHRPLAVPAAAAGRRWCRAWSEAPAPRSAPPPAAPRTRSQTARTTTR